MIEMKDWTRRVFTTVGARGPTPQEYAAVTLAFKWVRRFVPDYRSLIKELVIDPHEAWLARHKDDTCEDPRPYFNVVLHMWHQPHGYAGDGNLLTKLYRMLDTPLWDKEWNPVNPWVFSQWDAYISSVPETLALQSRREYVSSLAEFCAEKGGTSWLDVACGIGEFAKQVQMEQGDRITRVCGIDNDPMSVSIARAQNSVGQIDFREGNALKGLPDTQFDTVYCAGMFDYLNDDLFVRLGKRLLTVQPKHVMIGNIAKDHPSAEMMECLGWALFDRSRFELLVLGEQIDNQASWTVDTDRTGIQHFLRLERS